MYITRTVQESHVQYSKIVLLCFQFCWIDLTWGALLFRSMFAVFSTSIAVVITTLGVGKHSSKNTFLCYFTPVKQVVLGVFVNEITTIDLQMSTFVLLLNFVNARSVKLMDLFFKFNITVNKVSQIE